MPGVDLGARPLILAGHARSDEPGPGMPSALRGRFGRGFVDKGDAVQE